MRLYTLAGFIAAVSGVAVPLARRQLGTSDTENQFVSGNTCNDITVLFARGTTESGNVGTLVGPPFFQALQDQVGADKLTVQGVDYAANVAGFRAGGDAAGSQTLAGLIGQVCGSTELSDINIDACRRSKPNAPTPSLLYLDTGELESVDSCDPSMGADSNPARVVNSFIMLPIKLPLIRQTLSTQVGITLYFLADCLSRPVVIFGDPDNGQAVGRVPASKTLIICHNGDNICEGGDQVLLPHLTYSQNADQAASFVVSQAGA